MACDQRQQPQQQWLINGLVLQQLSVVLESVAVPGSGGEDDGGGNNNTDTTTSINNNSRTE